MTAATRTIVLLVFTSLGVINVESQGFVEVPTNTCLPCGGPAKFNCTTIVNHTVFHDGRIVLVHGYGGQLWRIQTTNGMTEFLYSTIPDNVPASYEFIHNEFISTGLLVHDTNSSWSGTTFQCIAYNQGNIEDLNNSSEPVTLEVGVCGETNFAMPYTRLTVGGFTQPGHSLSCQVANAEKGFSHQFMWVFPSPLFSSLGEADKDFQHTMGSPPNFTCQCWCPDVYHSDRCNIMWDRLRTVSCNSLQFSVSLTLPNGTSVYNESFGPSITQTTPLDLGVMYTATITAENDCGNATCSTECSPAPTTFTSTLEGRQTACLGEVVTYTCTVTQAGTLDWTAEPFIRDSNRLQFAITTPLQNRVIACGDSTSTVQCADLDYRTTLTIVGPVQSGFASMTSTLSFTASARVNGTVVQCRGSTAHGIQVASSNVIVTAIPSPPLTPSYTVEQYGRDSVTLTVQWQPPQYDGGAPVNYTITVSPGLSPVTTVSLSALFALPYNVIHTVYIVATNCNGSSSAALETIKIANCSDPAALRSGLIAAYHNTTEGAEIFFRCDPGFVPARRMRALCAADGRWTPNPADHMCTGDVQSLTMGATVGIAVLSTVVVIFIAGALAGALLFYCISNRRSHILNPESPSNQQQQEVPISQQPQSSNQLPQTDPEYEEVVKLRKNEAYELTKTGIEMKANEAYLSTQN